MKPTSPFILVDGSSYLYRAFHALPPLSNSRGEPTGAVYGVVSMLRKLLDDYEPEHIAVVLDASGKTFRDDLFEHYKAQRPPMPPELVSQIEPLQQVIRALGLPLLCVPGVEADDVIGTLALQAAQHGLPVVVSTSDKDMAQLVDGKVRLVNTMSGTELDAAGVMAKFGVSPQQMVDYLALAGDATDNIPGIPSIGPKTAAKLLGTYGSLDAILAHAAEIPGKMGENLRNCIDRARLSQELARIHCDVPLNVGLEDLKRRPEDIEALRAIFQRLEFKTWLSQLPAPEQPAPQCYETVYTEEQLAAWLQRLGEAPVFAFDTETTSLDYIQARIVGVSFAIEPGEAAYVPLAHSYLGAPAQLPRDQVLERLRPLLEDPAKSKLGHNLKYDMSVLANHGIELRGIRYDSMLESYVLDSTATRHDLDSLALKYLGHRTIHFEDVAGKGKGQLTFDQVPVEQAGPYAAEDADVALRLHQTFWPKLEAQGKLKELFETIEVPLIPVLSRMERNGVRIDAGLLRRQSGELAARMREIERRCHEEAGGPFNLDSPKQIQDILFIKLKLPVLHKTPKGQPSTAEAVLSELALDYPLPRLLLEYRTLSKLKSTYTDRLPEQINPATGRVHTSYHQAVAATGRLSSSDPNLQNIPTRGPEGRRIRQAFIAAPGYRMVAADYSQIELRILAHLSSEPSLLAAFAAGEDIHRATAAEVFNVAHEAVTDDQRRQAKVINFGLLYGMSAFGLSRQLGIAREEAQAYMERYFARYPAVQTFMESTRAQARKLGYVETLRGRRLYIPEINVANVQRRSQAERTAINAPMQGSAADIIKLAMIRCDAWLRESGPDARMIMQVHDELVFEIAEAELDDAIPDIQAAMAGAERLSVPLVVDIGVGSNWEEAH